MKTLEGYSLGAQFRRGSMVSWKVLINCTVTLLLSVGAEAKEQSRPDSIGGEYVLELNTGVAFEDSEDNLEVGIDFEKFVNGSRHHFSIGLATEIDFRELDEAYFLGPLLSAYYFHFKLFLTTGILTNFEEYNEWKTRMGLGYEIVWLEEWIIVPTLSIDSVENRLNLAASLGLAWEF